MSAVDFDRLIEQNHQMLGEFIRGNIEPAKKFFSHREDVTLANPFFPVACGWQNVLATLERAILNFKDGQLVGFDPVAKNATPDLAYTVEVERFKAKVGGGKDVSPVAIRVTSIFRPEEGVWKLVHRHADPITSPQPAESVIQK